MWSCNTVCSLSLSKTDDMLGPNLSLSSYNWFVTAALTWLTGIRKSVCTAVCHSIMHGISLGSHTLRSSSPSSKLQRDQGELPVWYWNPLRAAVWVWNRSPWTEQNPVVHWLRNTCLLSPAATCRLHVMSSVLLHSSHSLQTLRFRFKSTPLPPAHPCAPSLGMNFTWTPVGCNQTPCCLTVMTWTCVRPEPSTRTHQLIFSEWGWLMDTLSVRCAWYTHTCPSDQ